MGARIAATVTSKNYGYENSQTLSTRRFQISLAPAAADALATHQQLGSKSAAGAASPDGSCPFPAAVN